jgi:hypothetical protein
MEQEKEFTGQESLELIARMINTAKKDYYDTGVSSLLWGSLITFCSLVSFAGYYLKLPGLNIIWVSTLIAVVPQINISIRERKNRRIKTHDGDLMSGIWISFGISMFVLPCVIGILDLPNMGPVYMIIYGIPTFTTGYARRFRPMIIGGIACWVFAILASFAPAPFVNLYLAASAQLAWFIPGLILRKRYLKAKENHV